MGSQAYGIATESSDEDLYGFSIPTKELLFPYSAGYIKDFGSNPPSFSHYQQHHIIDDDKKEYDIAIYSIVRYFSLVMENNPNMIDSLFVPQHCIRFCTPIAQLVRENRWTFLHKGAHFKFKGYAFSQLNKATTKAKHLKDYIEFCKTLNLDPDLDPFEARELVRNKIPTERFKSFCRIISDAPRGKRRILIEKYGWDPKFLAHTVRLTLEIEQILTEHTLDLTRNSEHLKAVRSGEVSLAEIQRWFHDKELSLEKLYSSSALRHSPDKDFIKALLLQCLEHYFGDISKVYQQPEEEVIINAYNQIRELVYKTEQKLAKGN